MIESIVLTEHQALALLFALVNRRIIGVDQKGPVTEPRNAELLLAMSSVFPPLRNICSDKQLETAKQLAGSETDIGKARAMFGRFFETWGRALRYNAGDWDRNHELDNALMQRDEISRDAAAIERVYDEALDAIPREFRKSGEGRGPLLPSILEMLQRASHAAGLEKSSEAMEGPIRHLEMAIENDVSQLEPDAMKRMEASHHAWPATVTLAAELLTKVATCCKGQADVMDKAFAAIPAGYQSYGRLDQVVASLVQRCDKRGEELEHLQDWLNKNAPWYIDGDSKPPLNTPCLVAVLQVDRNGGDDKHELIAAVWTGDKWVGAGIIGLEGVVAWRPLPKFKMPTKSKG